MTARLDDGRVALVNGRVETPAALWPLELEGALLERLALGDVGHVADFMLRLRLLQPLALREADGLGSFTRIDPVRWLLADEVGLGKTIEAARSSTDWSTLAASNTDRTGAGVPVSCAVRPDLVIRSFADLREYCER